MNQIMLKKKFFKKYNKWYVCIIFLLNESKKNFYYTIFLFHFQKVKYKFGVD